VDAGPGPVLELGPAMSWGQALSGWRLEGPRESGAGRGRGRAVDTRAIPPPRRRRCRRLRRADLRQGRPGNDSRGGALP